MPPIANRCTEPPIANRCTEPPTVHRAQDPYGEENVGILSKINQKRPSPPFPSALFVDRWPTYLRFPSYLSTIELSAINRVLFLFES